VIAMPSQFQQLLQGQSIGSITPQQILAAGQPVFLDIRTNADISAINKLIESYGRIHAPTYGQPIPLSGLVTTAVGSDDLLSPDSTEVRKVLSINVTNDGAAPITGWVTIGGVPFADIFVGPGSAIVAIGDLYSSKGLPLAVQVTDGVPGDLTTDCASILVIQ